jgi:hypothetical protein
LPTGAVAPEGLMQCDGASPFRKAGSSKLEQVNFPLPYAIRDVPCAEFMTLCNPRRGMHEPVNRLMIMKQRSPSMPIARILIPCLSNETNICIIVMH